LFTECVFLDVFCPFLSFANFIVFARNLLRMIGTIQSKRKRQRRRRETQGNGAAQPMSLAVED
jgi:hypothetical protein